MVSSKRTIKFEKTHNFPSQRITSDKKKMDVCIPFCILIILVLSHYKKRNENVCSLSNKFPKISFHIHKAT